jgi:hypothetical protein
MKKRLANNVAVTLPFRQPQHQHIDRPDLINISFARLHKSFNLDGQELQGFMRDIIGAPR